jgi:hypothetical protein
MGHNTNKSVPGSREQCKEKDGEQKEGRGTIKEEGQAEMKYEKSVNK